MRRNDSFFRLRRRLVRVAEELTAESVAPRDLRAVANREAPAGGLVLDLTLDSTKLCDERARFFTWPRRTVFDLDKLAWVPEESRRDAIGGNQRADVDPSFTLP